MLTLIVSQGTRCGKAFQPQLCVRPETFESEDDAAKNTRAIKEAQSAVKGIAAAIV